MNTVQSEKQQQVHPAAVAQEFMTRAELKGREVDVYVQTFNWLRGFTAGELVAIPVPEYEKLQKDAKEGQESNTDAT